MSFFRKIAAALLGFAFGVFGGLCKATWEAVTKRSLDAERAEAQDAMERQAAAEAAQAELESRHEETLAVAAEQAAALRDLRRELAVMAERRARHEAFGRAHAEAAEVRSSRWRHEPEPESGAPLAPAPAY